MENPAYQSIQNHGHRLTRQRRLVLTILEESDEHLDAETIYMRAKARDPRISLATVYRSLALLKDINLIQKRHLGQDHVQYETRDPLPHFHFTCSQCGSVIEFQIPNLETWIQAFAREKGLSIEEIQLLVNGRCKTCTQQEEKTNPAW